MKLSTRGDKKKLNKISTEVATFKENKYALKKYFWGQVNENWVIYTDTEKQYVKDKKKKILNVKYQKS